MKKTVCRRASALALCAVLAAASFSPLAETAAQAEEREGKQDTADKTLRLYYDEPAPITGIDNTSRDTDSGFEEHSLPLGCGYMGVEAQTQRQFMLQRTVLQIPIRKTRGIVIRVIEQG